MPRPVRVKMGIKVDADGLRRHLAVFSKVMGLTAKDVVRTQAGLFCQDMLSYTLPVDGQPGGRRGESLGARNTGIASLSKDIDKIFKPLEKANYSTIASANDYGIFAEYVAARRKAGMAIPKYVEKGMDGYVDATKAWMQFRSSYGFGEQKSNGLLTDIHGDAMREDHVRARGGTNVDDYSKKVAANSKHAYFITDHARKVAKYKAKASEHVGRMKSGWLEAGMALGRKMRAPGWIARHVGGGNGILEDNSDSQTYPVVVVGNRIQGLMTKSPGKDLWKAALNHRAYAMRVDMEQRLRKATKGSETSVLQVAEALRLVQGPDE